jgi:hypothetical protein
MKKRLLIIGLVLALLVMMLAPATALASFGQINRGPANTDFSGSGLIFVTYMPDPVIKGNLWRYQGEIAEGFLDQCDWDSLAGTAFWSEHDSTVWVDDQGNAKGTMRGSFTLTRPDGTGVMEGTFTGRISGNLVTGDISDIGTWRSTGGNGVFEGVKSWGNWSADLHYGLIPGTDIATLVGPVSWSGKYMNPVNWQDIVKPGKPIKPWKPAEIIKPGKPIKPWKPVSPWNLIWPWKR